MFFHKLEEAGYESALLGLSLSFYDHKEPLDTWWDTIKKERANHRASSLSGKGLGHDKFLRSIVVWAYIQAPRSFYSEFDTYQVGMTKNSSSTMHTIDKRPVELSDFSAGTSIEAVDMFNNCLLEYKDSTSPYYKDIARLKENLPEGWLQERQICTNYAVLQNIINQRYKHRLHYWRYLCTEIMKQIDHPELLTLPEK